MSAQKILITGASGFIGHYLSLYLSQKNYQVLACTSINSREQHPHYAVYPMQLPSSHFVSLVDEKKPDVLIHCAGTSSVANSFICPEKDFTNNVTVTNFILNTLKNYSPHTKLIFFSSAAVYGTPGEIPISTTTIPQPISPYGYHKFISEINCSMFHRLFNIPVIIVRAFSVYGPGLKKQLLWDIYQKTLYADKVTLFGNGEETRDFIYIDDVAKVIAHLIINSPFDAPIFNIATGQTITISQLANLMLSKLNTKATLSFTGQTKQGDPLHWKVSQKSVSELGLKDWLPIEIGVQYYVEWLKNKID